jgi:hypothetical protein
MIECRLERLPTHAPPGRGIDNLSSLGGDPNSSRNFAKPSVKYVVIVTPDEKFVNWQPAVTLKQAGEPSALFRTSARASAHVGGPDQ